MQFLWDSKFEYEVRAVKPGHIQIDYNDKKQAAWSHYYFAQNLLANHAPVDYTLPHIETACLLLDDIGVFHELLACAYIISGDLLKAKHEFKQAQAIDPKAPTVSINMQRLASGEVNSVLLPNNCGEYTLTNNDIIRELKQKNSELSKDINELTQSTCWKITKPIRILLTALTRLMEKTKIVIPS